MLKKDTIYKTKNPGAGSFVFNREVADVFDDMAVRSIPGYLDTQRIIGDCAGEYYRNGTKIYDLGCSTGASILSMHSRIASIKNRSMPQFVGVDASSEMIEIAHRKCEGIPVQWVCSRVEDVAFEKSSVVLANYVMQFIPPRKRAGIISHIYNTLIHQGIFIISEKTISADKKLEKLMNEGYYDFKLANGYSQHEIDMKARALKNVLKPMTLEWYLDILRETGFKKISIISKHWNFTCIMAIK